MTLQQLIQNIHLAYKGNDRYPSDGDVRWLKYLSIANRKIREWASDANIDWASLYEERVIGSASEGTVAYSLDEDLLKLSDYVYVGDTPYQVVKPGARNEIDGCFVSGNPPVLTFSNALPDNLLGESISVGAYWKPVALSRARDEVRIDNPDWVVYAVAAELARNDFAKDDQFPNLVGIANDLYSKMVAANQNAPYLQPAAAEVRVDQIGQEF